MAKTVYGLEARVYLGKVKDAFQSPHFLFIEVRESPDGGWMDMNQYCAAHSCTFIQIVVGGRGVETGLIALFQEYRYGSEEL